MQGHCRACQCELALWTQAPNAGMLCEVKWDWDDARALSPMRDGARSR